MHSLNLRDKTPINCMPTSSLIPLRLPFFLLLILYTTISAAQAIPVTISVQTAKKEPVAAASISLSDRIDSLALFSQIADSAGKAVFELAQGQQYFVTITSVGYLPLTKGITITPASTVFSFTLNDESKTLGTVVVSAASKPLMRQEDDKTIIDPESLAAASTNGYEIIEKTPGLFVDQDGNIYLNSTTPASVQINGREMKMSTADIATMLKSLPPDAIARIEVLRTPSARYDASGSGGLVNIILKKGVRIGLTGSINTGMQQGQYGSQFAGLNLNNNNGRTTTYLNLNFTRRNSYERIATNRLYAPDSLLQQEAFTRYPAFVYYGAFGWSRELTSKWELTYDTRLSYTNSDNNTNNHSIIKKISTGDTITNNLAQVHNDGRSLLWTNGLTAKYKIDSSGSEWRTDISHTYANGQTDQLYNTFFYFPPVVPGIGGSGNIDNRRNFTTLQSDLVWKLPDSYTVETGVKSSLLQYNSRTRYFRKTGSTQEPDGNRTNTYRYRENINAFYLQGSKTISSITIKMGARLENTNMQGRQLVPGDTSFNLHRTDLFPYVYLSRKLMKIAGFDLRSYLVYRRTISRPVYEQLNPFPRYVDQFVSEAGNPSLRPQFTQNYEANVSIDERPILAVGMNRTKDIFSSVFYQADSTRSQAIRTYDNIGTSKEFYLRALGAIPPGKRYFFVLGAQYNHNFYQGQYEGSDLSFKRGGWLMFTYHEFKLDRRSRITMNGFWRFKGPLQFYELNAFGAVNANINRQFLNRKLVVTASINDIFRTNRNDFILNQGTVNASGSRRADTRRVGLNIRYNFGIRKKEESSSPFNIAPPEN